MAFNLHSAREVTPLGRLRTTLIVELALPEMNRNEMPNINPLRCGNPARCLWMLLLLFCVSTMGVEGVTLDWNFVSSNGSISVEGVFATDGSYEDTQGTGTHVFNITEWKVLTLNGGDTGIPAERFPASPVAKTFSWDRETQSVLYPNSTVLNAEFRNEAEQRLSFFQLAFSPSQSRMQDLVDFSPNFSFVPVTSLSSFTPVPEPADFALSLGLLSFVAGVWRRRLLRREAGLVVGQQPSVH